MGYPSLEFVIDGTERGINRPKYKESQKETYSRKKKTHTIELVNFHIKDPMNPATIAPNIQRRGVGG